MDLNIVEKINDDLSLEELREITKTALAAIYRKLRNDLGYGYDMHCSVVRFGSSEYDVEMVITSDSTFGDGEQYISTYWI